MMKKITCSGFGGQGVLTLGMILAHAAAAEGKFVTWVPAYGSEMRGGEANCKIKISDEPIASPYMKTVDILVALNEQSLEKFADALEPGGCIVVNSSIVKHIPKYHDRKVIPIPANEIAEENKNPKGVGLAIVGGIIACSDFVSFDTAIKAMEDYFAEKGINVKANRDVFVAGYQYVRDLTQSCGR